MIKLFKRFIAYTIDMMVITIIAQSLTGIPQINFQLDNYNKYYNKYMETFENYGNFKLELNNSYKDNKLTEKEYQKLIEKHENYQDILTKYYSDQKLTKKEYNKINTTIDKQYQKEYRNIYYKIEKNSIVYFSIYIITIFAYFIGFNKLTNGQTLGKKLTRLKIKSSKENREQVPIWSYLVRSLILYQPLYYIIKLIASQILNINNYYTITSAFYNVQYYLELLTIIFITVRLDGRGIHDLLAQTKVVQIDRDGNELPEKESTLLVRKKL